MIMKRTLFVILSLYLLCSCAYAFTLTGAKLPYDATFCLGLVNGPGTGVDIGADLLIPMMSGLLAGPEVGLLITNSDYEQNISMQRYGVVIKYVFTDDFYVTFHVGSTSYYLSKLVDFTDSFSGEIYTIDEDTHGSASYWAVAPTFKIWDYYFAPKMVFNRLQDGGTIFEMYLSICHMF